ncbi:MAG: phasin family protein [Holosporaceae bacterium]
MTTFDANDRAQGSTHKADSGHSKSAFNWGSFSSKSLPIEALLASHRKNMDTIRQAQQTAAELVKDLVSLNNQYVRHSFDEMSNYTKSFVAQMNPEKGAATSAAAMEKVKTSFDRSMSHCKQVTDLFSQSASKVFNNYRQRFDEGLKEAEELSSKGKN